MKKDFLAIYAGITCPHCNVKQTGVERMYNPLSGQWATHDKIDPSVVGYLPGIKCVWSKCGKLITGDDLERITEKVVKYPSDL